MSIQTPGHHTSTIFLECLKTLSKSRIKSMLVQSNLSSHQHHNYMVEGGKMDGSHILFVPLPSFNNSLFGIPSCCFGLPQYQYTFQNISHPPIKELTRKLHCNNKTNKKIKCHEKKDHSIVLQFDTIKSSQMDHERKERKKTDQKTQMESKLIYEVLLLTLAHKKKGIRPLAMSCETASLSKSGERAYPVEESAFSSLQFSG